MVTIIGSVRLLPNRPVQPAFRHLPFVLFLLGILAYGAALVWYMLLRFDLGSLLRLNGDDAFYYFQIARNLAAGEFSTFDGGITRTNGYHPLWLLLIMQSVFRLTARRRPAGSGKACHRAGD